MLSIDLRGGGGIPHSMINLYLEFCLLGRINNPKPFLSYKPIDSQCPKYVHLPKQHARYIT